MVSAAKSERIDWEAALVQRARNGDARAFERLYREHIGRVHGLCLRLLREPSAAEDCAQETFINAWRGLKNFDSRSAFGTWLHRIAVNVALARRRRPAWMTEPLPDADEQDRLDAVEWTLDTPVEESEIEAAVRELPDGARDVLVLCAIYGYSHGQASEMLGVAEGTCKAQLHRARALLRRKLSPEGSP